MPPLGHLFSRLHSMSHHHYADNTRVYFFAQPDKHEATIISPALLFKFQSQKTKTKVNSVICQSQTTSH